MELYIIRHGQSSNNALLDQSKRVADPELTAMGRQQAELLARELAGNVDPADRVRMNFGGPAASVEAGRGHGVTRLFCSPMWRAMQTAEPVARALGLKPEVWIDIHEHGGIFLEENGTFTGYGGKTRPEILTLFPNYRLPAGVTGRGWWTGDFEPLADRELRHIRVARQLRAWAAAERDGRPGAGDDENVERIGAEYRTGERIAMISHGGFINGLLRTLFNQPAGPLLFFQHYNTAITRIVFRADGRLIVDYVNRVDFLPPEMLT